MNSRHPAPTDHGIAISASRRPGRRRPAKIQIYCPKSTACPLQAPALTLSRLAPRLLNRSALAMEESRGHTPELNAILVADDDEQLATALQWILADEKFLVDVALN